MGLTKHRRGWFIVLGVAAIAAITVIAAIALLTPSPGQQAQAYELGASTVTVNVSPGTTVDVGETVTLDVDWVPDTDGRDEEGHHHGFWTFCLGDHWIVVDWDDESSDQTDPLSCLGDPASDFFTHSYGSPGTYEACATVWHQGDVAPDTDPPEDHPEGQTCVVITVPEPAPPTPTPPTPTPPTPAPTPEPAGCSPGFWKNHTEIWINDPNNPWDLVEESWMLVILADHDFGTEQERQAVADLLNAAYPDAAC